MTATAATRIFAALSRALAPRKPLTVSQWADAERFLSSKGSAEPGRWRTSRNPPLREPMDCLSARSMVRDTVLMFPIQFGKALALDTPIPTPSGWTTMQSIAVDDEVLGADGRPARVIAASPVFVDHECYRLTFSDGCEVVADAGHRWEVVDLRSLNEDRREIARRDALSGTPRPRRKEPSDRLSDHAHVLETHALAAAYPAAQSRFAVRVAAPLDLPPRELSIDPYLLGAWLGDGTTSGASITTMDPEVIGAFADFDPVAYKSQNSGRATTYGLRRGFLTRLRAIGVLGAKHIPADYLRASAEQRLALLQGLMDTDGHSARHAEITSSSLRLAADIVELVRGLGFKPTVRWRSTSCRDSARITFAVFAGVAIFRLPRKLAALPAAPSARGRHAQGLRYIVAIDRVPTVPTRCIAVDNADHLFLCGRGFIPTHNTEVAINALGYVMDHSPGPVMVCLPGEVSMNKWVAQKLNPALDETPAMRRALTSVASRDAANQRTFKDFAGGQLYLEHAGSPQRLKSTTVRTMIADEVDEFAHALTSGDDPIELLNGRTSAFPSTSKRLYISTPQLRGVSRIERLYLKSDQRRYYVPCPDCHHEQPLEWSGLHWSPDGAQCWYACRECGVAINEHHKTRMIEAGRWVAENPGAPIRGYTINGLYYPIGLGPRWLDLVAMWRDAQNDPARLKTFVNDRLAEPWEDPAMRAVRHNVIADRAEPYRLRSAPHGVLAITAGVDTQDNRLAVQIVGWGRGLACWVLDYVELLGDPADDAVWVMLVELLSRPIEHASGGLMRVDAVAIDAGGHRTEAVKAFVRDCGANGRWKGAVRRPMAIFGAVSNNATVISNGKLQDVNWRGQLDRRGVTIHHVGTVGVKHKLYSWLSTDAEKAPEARRVHLSSELEPSYFTGLVSETYNPAKNRFEKRGGARNEPLDTWVYAYAATHHKMLRLQSHSKADWDAREAMIAAAPADADVAAPAPAITPPASADQAARPTPIPRPAFRRNW